MGSHRGQWALALVVLAATVAASSAWGAPLRVLVSRTPNKTDTNRTARTIQGIVIHDTEGSFASSIRTLQNPRVDGSAHFVVSRTGEIVQLVPVTDVAWQAGDHWWNLHAIGIEHVGHARYGGYTDAEYRASAELVAYLAHRWGIPLDRSHVIGHDEVPDPNHPGRFGGVDHHTDPGPRWRWAHYMALVRHYAAHRVLPRFVKLRQPPQPRPAAAPPHVTAGARLRGRVPWWSGIDAVRRLRHRIWKVDFVVDGRTVYTDHTWPFDFNRNRGFDTTTVANGRHMLALRLYGAGGYRARVRLPVRVVNPPMVVQAAGAVAGGSVEGDVTLHVSVDQRVERVALVVDGRTVSRDGSAPYTLSWDTTLGPDGPHDALVAVEGRHGHRGLLALPVIVANGDDFPPALSRDWLNRDAFGNE